MGVDTGGAGDQRLMFRVRLQRDAGLMPLPIMLRWLVRGLSALRRDGTFQYLQPDGKSQVRWTTGDQAGGSTRWWCRASAA